jgi:hypothetical protein
MKERIRVDWCPERTNLTTVTIMKSREIGWVSHAARMLEMRN